MNRPLRIRNWILKNNEWFMGEVVFHRENQKFFNKNKIPVWKFDSEDGRGVVK